MHGRSLSGTLAISRDMVNFDFYILSGGAIIYNKDHQLIYEKNISFDIVKSIVNRIKDIAGCIVMAEVEAYTLFKDELDIPAYFKVFNDVEELAGNRFCSVSVNADSTDKASEICADINSMFGDQVIAYQNVTSVDISPIGCSKRNGFGVAKGSFRV